jgi:hypothetical protein
MASTTLSNGQIIPAEVPMKTQPAQVVTGGILNAAADKTVTANAHQAEVAAKMGAGQKGGRRKKTKRGGGTLNAPSSLLPTASSIPGVDPTNTSIKHIDTLNAIRAAAAGDKLANAAPYYPKSGGKRTKRKANGRRHNRTHRRGHRKSSNGGRRSRRNV